MILRSLSANAFRNLERREIPFHHQTNILVGRNGQGKTNLLEAIYFLATTKSFRTPRVSSLFQFDSPNVYVTGQLQRFGVERALSVGLETGEVKRRALQVNGEKVTLSAYLNAMSVFAYSASRLEILRGGPEEKRRFLDRGLASVQGGYLEQLGRCTRILKQKNALLQSRQASAASLDAWDVEFAAAAALVQDARATYAAEVFRTYRKIVADHDYHVDGLTLEYRPSVPDASRLRREELRAGTSLAGPQRDSIEFTVSGRAAHEVLSGGEQKMVVLFLKFAKLELFRDRFDEPAIFLLDDVDAELDLEILQKLMIGLPPETQVFATSAKETFLDALRAGPHRRLVIENGTVRNQTEFA